jgi:molecular chaperone GrpE
MEVVGQAFDSDLHEAIAMVPGQPEEMKGKVMDCMTPGYTLNDKVIRYAKVAVAE